MCEAVAAHQQSSELPRCFQIKYSPLHIKLNPIQQEIDSFSPSFISKVQSKLYLTFPPFFSNFNIMPMEKEQPIPPPVIGKIGYYTVFVTPNPNSSSKPDSDSQKKNNFSPVQPPPVHYEKTASSLSSNFGFFWDAMTKLQNAHSSLDDYLAHWFGLNQSKYQWALDDYYENESMEKVDTKAKDIPCKAQSV